MVFFLINFEVSEKNTDVHEKTDDHENTDVHEKCYSVNDLFMNNRNPTEPCEMCSYAIHNMRLRNTVFVNTRFSRADA